jgi:hypothetical protein
VELALQPSFDLIWKMKINDYVRIRAYIHKIKSKGVIGMRDSRVLGFNAKKLNKLQQKQIAPVAKNGKENPPASNRTPPIDGPTIIPRPKHTSVRA